MQSLGDKVGAIIGPQVFWFAPFKQKRIQRLQHICRAHLRGNSDTQGFAGVLIQDRQHLVASSVTPLIVHKINRPDVIWVFRPQTDDRSIVMIEPLALAMTLRELQTLFTP